MLHQEELPADEGWSPAQYWLRVFTMTGTLAVSASRN
jgi:hypothetical protein